MTLWVLANKRICMYTHTHIVTRVSRCPVGWRGYRCEIEAASMDSSSSSGSKSHSSESLLKKPALWFYLLTLNCSLAGTASIVIPVLLLLLLALLVVGAILWYKRRMRG